MTPKLLLIKNIDDFKNLKEISNIDDYEIFSLDIDSHNFLEKKKIPHKIGEQCLSKCDHNDIYKHTISYYNWYENSLITEKIEYENYQLLSLFDTGELHHILIREIYLFFTIKRIIERFEPDEILCNSQIYEIVTSISQKITCKIINHQEKHILSPFEQYSFSISALGIKIPIKLSRKSYLKIKNFFESIIGKFLGLNYDLKNKTNSVLFLELNPEHYPNLLKYIQKNIIFLNQRRPAIWNWKSIKLLRKYNCKILNPQNYLSSQQKLEISIISEKYLKEIEKFWKNKEIFSKLFVIEGCSFWKNLDNILLKIYQQRLQDYVTLVYFSKNILSKLNIDCFLSLNVFGETEKIILFGNKDIDSILLEHGFTNYVPELSLFDISNMYQLFPDKIAIWGPIQKNYLVTQHEINDSKILMSGSPRHDDFFNTISKNHSFKKNILIVPGMLDAANGIYDTDCFLRYEKLLTKLFSILKNLPDYNLTVKLHPSTQPNNLYIKNYIQKIAPEITINQFSSIKDDILNSDFIINIHSELVPSTVLLEGMILKKPIMNITMLDNTYDFEFLKDNAVLNVSDKSNFEKNLLNFLSNTSLQKQLINSATNHVNRYLVNPGNASKTLASMINSIKDK